MSEEQLLVGPNDSASLIYSDSSFETGQITLNGTSGNALNILSTSENAANIQGSLSVSSNLFLGSTQRWKISNNSFNDLCFFQLNSLGTSYVLLAKINISNC